MAHLPLRRRSRGVAILLVLGLLAITLALSYACLRGQGATTHLARNTSRDLDAREAARSGLADALRRISDDSWAGVGVPLTGNVTGHAWYEVTFATGDSRLLPVDPLDAEDHKYPFRLTIDSTGYAADPADPSLRAIHRSRCVVQLVRTALLPEPASWTSITNFNVYQWGNRNVLVQPPVRIHGRAQILGKAWLATEYPQDSAARDRYLRDLNAMRLAGLGDYRPFDSPLTLAYSRQDSAQLVDLQSDLGLVTVDTLAATTPPVSHPGIVSTYQLYPGGMLYTVPVIQDLVGSSTVSDATFVANLETNPLGIYRSRGPLNVQSNVRIHGTLITDGSMPEVQIYGTNVVMEAAELPSLYGSNERYQLPAALIRDSLRINNPSATTIRGFTGVWNDFEIKRGSPNTTLDLRGNLLTGGLTLRGRDTWTLNLLEWTSHLTNFTLNLLLDLLDPNRLPYFPQYLQREAGMLLNPKLQLAPGEPEFKPHWQDWTKPIYAKLPSDPGLRWDLIRWEDDL